MTIFPTRSLWMCIALFFGAAVQAQSLQLKGLGDKPADRGLKAGLMGVGS